MLSNIERIRKEKLDSLIKLYKAQPVGNGYIDIIVSRDYYKDFVRELINNGFVITSISWWEYCNDLMSKSKYGLGGPPSKFFDGWFSELCEDIDDVDTNEIDAIYNKIENKTLVYSDMDIISFKNNDFLTPAFWLDIPDTWEYK